MTEAHKLRNAFLLFLTAMIWGAAFVAQSVSMDYVGPLTFIFLRSLIGGAVLIPVIMVMDKHKAAKSGGVAPDPQSGWKNRTLIIGSIVCGIFLFFGNYFQQNGIKYTTVGKAGFITSFYIIIIPVVGIFFKRYCGALTWVSVLIALLGLYFLCMTDSFTLQKGDILILIAAFMFSGQVLSIDHYNPYVDSVKLSCLQFLVCGAIAFVGMIFTETPEWSMIRAAAAPILYAGVMSTGVGYTLQTVGQKGLHPAVAALIMSMESVFSAVFGFLLLHQVLSGREVFGCVLVFAAIILAQIPDFYKRKG